MALTDKLTAIGVAIRAKTGKSDLLTLDQMPTEIASITTGGGGGEEFPDEAFNLTGKCAYKFAYDSWKWFLEMYKNRITTHNITAADNMFRMITSTEIPFDINVTNIADMSYMFYNSQLLKVCPRVRGTIKWNTSTTLESMLSNMTGATSLEDIFTPEMLEGFSDVVITSSYSAPKLFNFSSCNSLRSVPSWFYKVRLNETSPYFPYYNLYSDLFNSCKALDEVRDLQVWTCQGEQSTNMLDRTFRYTNRLKTFTFETNEDGTPVTAKWKSQLLDLSKNVGYTNSYYVDGISEDKKVSNDATYQALKNDPDWYSVDSAYSRYNHDSAVETINSLPDTSATGTNTIKFLGSSGAKTDGGAINTLTEEEIAVAAARGWTVTYA